MQLINYLVQIDSLNHIRVAVFYTVTFSPLCKKWFPSLKSKVFYPPQQIFSKIFDYPISKGVGESRGMRCMTIHDYTGVKMLLFKLLFEFQMLIKKFLAVPNM